MVKNSKGKKVLPASKISDKQIEQAEQSKLVKSKQSESLQNSSKQFSGKSTQKAKIPIRPPKQGKASIKLTEVSNKQHENKIKEQISAKAIKSD